MERELKNDSATKTQKRKINQKAPQARKKTQKLSQVLIQQKTLLCQITRIRGQQKLLYIKQAKQKKFKDEQFFSTYPFCELQMFKLDIKALQKNGIIFRDDVGLHWVESMTDSSHNDHAQAHQGAHHASQHLINNSKVQKNLLNGWGISIFKDGKIFQGVYHDSFPCGLGYQLQPNGNTYIGEFKQGAKVGKGSYYWFNSQQLYIGQWLGGLPHGYGKYLSSGDLYEGQFCNGMKYGYGDQIFKNGDRYVGEYINGVADGYGQYYWKDASIYKGDFKHGVRHGYGIWQDQGGKEQYKGCYRMDKKEGFGVYNWVGKQVYKGQFRDDFRQGYGRLYQLAKKFTNDTCQDSTTSEQKPAYIGMWYRGKQKPELQINEQMARQLDSFISEKKINANPKKHRVGHQNCIPKEY